jgi:HEAT repeat protein
MKGWTAVGVVVVLALANLFLGRGKRAKRIGIGVIATALVLLFAYPGLQRTAIWIGVLKEEEAQWLSERERRIKRLTEQLNSEIPEERVSAAEALGQTAVTPEVVPALIKALGDEQWNVRRFASDALGTIGPRAQDAVPALANALADENWEVRWGAAFALRGMGPAAQDAVPALATALGDEKREVRWCAALALGETGPRTKAALAALTRALGDEEPDVGRLCCPGSW